MLPASHDSLAPGVSFGSYVVREPIGRGGMASVYRAEHLLLEKPVALKVMDRSLLATAGARQRFVLEGRAAAAIKHPNVVDITDVGVHDDVPFLVMELLTGEDLDAHLKRHGPLDETATVRLALPLISALHAAHSRGVVHRDIKPSNIFLSEGPDEQIVPKLLDFGISKVMSEGSNSEVALTPHHQVMGTPRYLPPEALHGARELGPASDQFSLGVVLYECVTGVTPFSGDTLIALLNALSAGGFRSARSLAPAISADLDRAIMRALATQPHERFPTLRDMGRTLLELAAARTQMVWGHSFKAPGEDSAKLARSVQHTELIERHEASPPRRYRPLIFGASFIAIGALASVVTSELFDSTRGALRATEPTQVVQHESVRPEAVVQVASLPAPADPPVRATAAAAERESSAAPAPATERGRQARAQARHFSAGRVSSGSNPRRGERGGGERRADARSEPTSERPSSAPTARSERASAAPEPSAETRQAAALPAEPSAAPAPPAPAPSESAAPRRRGANQSPFLD